MASAISLPPTRIIHETWVDEIPVCDFHYCQSCGVSLDIGQDCPECREWHDEQDNTFLFGSEALPATTGQARQIQEAVV